ncbi:hypothetical protein CsSME_00045806 [Camellia sinensis var. sinensis]
MELPPLASKPVLEKKVAAYVEVVKNLNNARERSFPFKPATVFKGAYESLGLDTSSGKSVSMQNIWHLIQTLMGEGSTVPRDVSKKMSLVTSARRHLKWGHEKYIIDTIQDKKCNRVSCSSYCCGFRCLNTCIAHPRPCDRSKWICYSCSCNYYRNCCR